MPSIKNVDLESQKSYQPPAQWWSFITPWRKDTLRSAIDEERFLYEGWARNKGIIQLFAGIVFLQTIYTNITYSVIYETTKYRNVVIYAGLYPITVAIVILSFSSPLASRFKRVIWYTLLSLAGVMMTCQISIKLLLCSYSVEDQWSCDVEHKPLRELQWVYAIMGPLLMLMIMRNHWPAQLVAIVFMFMLVIWAGAVDPNTEPFVKWSAVAFTMGASIIALLVAQQRVFNEESLFARNTSNEQLRRHLVSEVEEKTIAQQKAIHEEEKRNQFTSYIFHEIRNPLNTIILSVELLDMDNDLHAMSASVIENFSRIKVALTSIESIINDTLDLRKMNEGKLSLNPRPFDFHRMVRTSVWTMESMWLDKNITLTTQLDENITALPQIVGDETRLHQVLTNYLSNAVKFTPPGGEIILITHLETELPGTALITVTVKDTGIGVSEQDQKKLFHEFVQIDPERNQGGKGTGLGLSICAGIIRSMNGEYGVRSKLNEGSAFFFRVMFPLSSLSIQDTPSVKEAPTAKPFNDNSNTTDDRTSDDRAFKLFILVTDDDPMQRRIMTQLLSRIGHQIETAVDGVNCLEKVALSIAKGQPYDVIFIDNQMPRLQGGDTIQMLRKSGVQTHIISLTATADTDLHEHLRNVGATEILVKPSSKALIDKALKMLPFPGKLPISKL